MKILVTGGAGFIGSFLVDKLVELGHQVRIFDNLDPQVHPKSKKPSYINESAEFIKGDVRDQEALRNALEGIEIVYHKAAAVGVGQSQYDIKRYVDVNVCGTGNLLDILANGRHSVKKIISAGSMTSFGEGLYKCSSCGPLRPGPRPLEQLERREWEPRCPKCGAELKPFPIPETESLDCTSYYAVTKKTQEEMILLFGRTYDISTTIFRYFNVYGPRQSLSNPYTGVIAIFLSRLKNNNKPVIYEDGKQTRDFISVHDVVDANIMALENKKSDNRVFCLGSGKGITIADIAKISSGALGKNIEPQITGDFRLGDIRHCVADTTLINNELRWSPKIPFERGLAELIEWAKGESSSDAFDLAHSQLKQKGLLKE